MGILLAERLKMAIKPVLQMGNPFLRRVAQPVTEFNTTELIELIDDMHDTMTSLDGAGIAAPQIGVGLRVVIFGVGANRRYPDAEQVPYTVLVNPQIHVLDPMEEEGWEGCLSVDGLRGLVPRYRKIRYRGVDPKGGALERIAEGFHARVVQHECDHLDGVLFPQRIRNMKYFGFEQELDLSVTPTMG